MTDLLSHLVNMAESCPFVALYANSNNNNGSNRCIFTKKSYKETHITPESQSVKLNGATDLTSNCNSVCPAEFKFIANVLKP